ncbi:MAG: peptidase T [Thermoleophilia bacterium]
MADERYSSPLAEELAADMLERFLRYVKIDTQAGESSDAKPTSAKQLDLTRLLARELKELGLDDATVHEHGYVLATLPGVAADGAPTVGLMAHVDTSPDESGANVKPQVVERYDCSDIQLPGNPKQVLSPNESKLLAKRIGHDIVTTDGTTLLGADDKAGVAEIMAAVAYLIRSEEPRAPLRVAFTVDEEVGLGAIHFDIDAYGADFAYTVDGTEIGGIDDESFSASEAVVVFHGRGVHPGSAKDKLVNSIKLAARFIDSLPPDTNSPETTDDREPYVHPSRIHGGTEETTVTLILRSFESDVLTANEELVRRLAEEAVADVEQASVDVEIRSQYRNMKETLDEHPQIVAAAMEAVRRAGLEPKLGSIRGGTDGSILTARGLPTPNIFTGGNEYHSVREWASVQDMAASAATLVELVRLWAEPEWRLS